MKVAMIGLKGVPSRAGGVEIHVEEIGARLADMGHEVHIYGRKKYCSELHKTYRGMKISYIPSIDTKRLDAITYTFLATIRALIAGDEVFHFHALGPSLFAFLPKIFRKDVVCTIHGLDWKREKWSALGKKMLLLGEQSALKYADATISVSDSLMDYFADTYGKVPAYIPNGVYINPKPGRELIKCEFGLEEDGYILFLSRIVPEKGLHFLIEAYQQLKTDKKLVIAGAASHSDDYFRQIHSMAEGDPNIIFTDFVQGEMLEQLFANAYLYVLPSTIEGLPISLLEAMSYGTCCLTSDIPENVSVIKDQGFTFESRNVTDLKKVLEELVRDRKGYDRIEIVNYIRSKYSWDLASMKTEQVYKTAHVVNYQHHHHHSGGTL